MASNNDLVTRLRNVPGMTADWNSWLAQEVENYAEEAAREIESLREKVEMQRQNQTLLRDENERLRKDADRYRWVRSSSWIRSGNDLDEAIDAAIEHEHGPITPDELDAAK